MGELDAEKLTPLLRLRYNNAIADAVADLGSADQIRRVFWGPRSTCMRRVRIDGRLAKLLSSSMRSAELIRGY